MKICSCDSSIKIKLRSTNEKLCVDCSVYIKWPVKDGEESTLNNRRKNAKKVLGKAIVRRNANT